VVSFVLQSLASPAISRDNTPVSLLRGVVVRGVFAVVGVWTLAASVPAAEPVANDVLVKRLIAALQDPDPDVRQNLASALAKIGPAAVEALTAALADDLPERRAGAAYALGHIGSPARSALPKLLDALDDKELDVRRQASYAVSRLVPSTTAKQATPPPTGGK
jgi:HEAT repeat protein